MTVVFVRECARATVVSGSIRIGALDTGSRCNLEKPDVLGMNRGAFTVPGSDLQ
jgi:hypothetical protein